MSTNARPSFSIIQRLLLSMASSPLAREHRWMVADDPSAPGLTYVFYTAVVDGEPLRLQTTTQQNNYYEVCRHLLSIASLLLRGLSFAPISPRPPVVCRLLGLLFYTSASEVLAFTVECMYACSTWLRRRTAVYFLSRRTAPRRPHLDGPINNHLCFGSVSYFGRRSPAAAAPAAAPASCAIQVSAVQTAMERGRQRVRESNFILTTPLPVPSPPTISSASGMVPAVEESKAVMFKGRALMCIRRRGHAKRMAINTTILRTYACRNRSIARVHALSPHSATAPMRAARCCDLKDGDHGFHIPCTATDVEEEEVESFLERISLQTTPLSK